jgi:hypothetical protein
VQRDVQTVVMHGPYGEECREALPRRYCEHVIAGERQVAEPEREPPTTTINARSAAIHRR